jgi:hypothetical protein
LRFPDGDPSAQMVVLTQEDLWVYQVLLTIIQNVNSGRIVPPIKKIEKLMIGKEAAEQLVLGMASGKIEVPKDASAAGATDAGVQQQAPEQSADGQNPAPDDRRYLDAEGKPMATGTLGDAPYKRMPVFIRLIIDQGEIDKLLVECANSPLPVEVNQCRLNPGATDSSPQPPTTYTRGSGGASASESNPNDVPIELSGIIYIYNPPDAAKLGSEAAEGAAPAATGG